MMWLNVGGVAVAAVVGAALIAAHGARGGAVATVLGEAGLAVGFGVALARAHADLRPAVGVLARVLAAAAIGALAALLPVPSVVQAVVGLALYAGALGAMGGWPELAMLRPRAR
jgi:hypothetical protein